MSTVLFLTSCFEIWYEMNQRSSTRCGKRYRSVDGHFILACVCIWQLLKLKAVIASTANQPV
jgi:hypothetical protein